MKNSRRSSRRSSLSITYNNLDEYLVCGKFPDWTASRLTLPRGQFPDGHFPERTIPRPDNSPKDISPTGHFPKLTFPRPDISLTTCFSEIFFFKSFFVCLY